VRRGVWMSRRDSGMSENVAFAPGEQPAAFFQICRADAFLPASSPRGRGESKRRAGEAPRFLPRRVRRRKYFSASVRMPPRQRHIYFQRV